jgi:hypothetical protein
MDCIGVLGTVGRNHCIAMVRRVSVLEVVKDSSVVEMEIGCGISVEGVPIQIDARVGAGVVRLESVFHEIVKI